MADGDFSDLQRRVAEFLWSRFSTTGEWPSRKQVLLAFRDEDPDIDQDVVTDAGIVCNQHLGPRATLSLTCDGALRLRDVELLLEPLPLLIQLAVKRFSYPPSTSSDPSSHHFTRSDLVRLWGDESRASLAWRAIEELRVPWLPLSQTVPGPDGTFWADASVGVLQFRGVTTLAECRAKIRDARPRDVGAYPHGPHLDLLVAAHAHLMATREWPVAMPFALRHQEIGYIPDLLRDLEPRFVRRGFGYSEHDRVELTADAAAVVDSSGILCSRLLAVVRALGALWWEWREGDVIPLSVVSSRVGESISTLESVVRYLDMDFECGLTRDNDGVLVFNPREQIRNAAALKSWAEYLAARSHRKAAVEPFLTHRGPFGLRHRRIGRDGDAPLPEDPLPGLESDISALGVMGALERVLFLDISEARQAFGAGAWKAFLMLVGSVAEGLLVGVLEHAPAVAESHMKVKSFERAGLRDFLQAATAEGLVNKQTTTLVALVADHRDLIHPIRSRRAELRVDEQTAAAAAHFLRSLVACLRAAANNGALHRFQLKGKRTT